MGGDAAGPTGATGGQDPDVLGPDGDGQADVQPAAASGVPRVPTLAERIDKCFTTMHAPDRGPWTYREVSGGIAARDPGVTMSPTYLHGLRTGKKDNPTLRQIKALAAFFNIDPAYFVGSDDQVESIDAEIELLQAMRTPGVKDLALRASSLSPRGIRAIAAIISELGGAGGESEAGRRGRTRKGRRQRGASDSPADPDQDASP